MRNVPVPVAVDVPGTSPHLAVSLTWRGRQAVVVASGELDAFTASPLRTRLAQAADAGARRLIIDLRGITFLGALGYSLIDGVRRRMAERGGQVDVVGASETARAIGAQLGVDLMSAPLDVPAGAPGAASGG